MTSKSGGRETLSSVQYNSLNKAEPGDSVVNTLFLNLLLAFIPIYRYKMQGVLSKIKKMHGGAITPSIVN
jgi:hypothetical protein